MRKKFCTILFLLATGLLFGQQEVPLLENPVLLYWRRQHTNPLPLPVSKNKNLCRPEKANVIYVNSGETREVVIGIDTIGFSKASYQCVGCSGSPFAAYVLHGDTLRITGRPRVSGGMETVLVSLCLGSDCRSKRFDVVVRRPGQNYFLDTRNLLPEASVTLSLDLALFSAPVSCYDFLDCPDAYDGRDQEAYFTTLEQPFDNFFYQAGRAAGIDSVCVRVCDTFAVCDTFRLSFRVRRDTVKLPFMEDFSGGGPFPSSSLWLDKEVFVNTNMSVDPPSIGVATFDGLGDNGTAYGGGYGSADRLTSTYIDLSNVGQKDNLFLTYYLQAKGLGDRPETQDSIILEFKDRKGNWIKIAAVEGWKASIPNTVILPFGFYRQQVSRDYQYNGFQFRFRNLSDRTGALDNWHLDYVRLSDNDVSEFFSDIAFSAAPKSILQTYTSMPWRHILGKQENWLADSIAAPVFNHSGEERNVSPSSVKLTEITTNTLVFQQQLFNGIDINVAAGLQKRAYSLSGGPSGFPAVKTTYLDVMKNAFPNSESLRFRMEYQLANASETNTYPAVKANNRVEQITEFDNYFAYDDGSAESGYIATPGNSIAMEFTSLVPDTLRAIQFHIPHRTVDVSGQLFHLKVWVGELDSTPEYEARSQRPFYTDSFFDTLQGFTTYPLLDAKGKPTPLYLPAGRFYIGWEQASPCVFTQCIPIGFDKGNPLAQQFIRVNTTGTWMGVDDAASRGALMIRAVVGDFTPEGTSTPVEEVLKDELLIRLFPNPGTGRFFVDLERSSPEELHYELYDSIGELKKKGSVVEVLDFTGLPPGLYLFKVVGIKSKRFKSSKIIIQK